MSTDKNTCSGDCGNCGATHIVDVTDVTGDLYEGDLDTLLAMDAEMANTPPTDRELICEINAMVQAAVSVQSKGSWFKRLVTWIKALFGGGDKEPDGPDEADFSKFNFTFGGVNAKNAKLADGVRIKHLGTHARGMSYTWAEGGCELLGAKNAGDWQATICCWFVKREDGTWVGGKFDWISSNRLSRGFVGHVVPNAKGETYGGWHLNGVPNPCDAAFVIINRSGSLRSNVIAGTWRR